MTPHTTLHPAAANQPATRVYSGENIGPDLWPAFHIAAARNKIVMLKQERRFDKRAGRDTRGIEARIAYEVQALNDAINPGVPGWLAVERERAAAEVVA